MKREHTYQTDVLIVGGGAAGIGAAIGAADQGVNVMLVERYPFAGGAATVAYVSTICGLFLRNDGESRWAMSGPVRAFAEALAREGQTMPVQFAKGLHFLPYSRDDFVSLADYVLGQYANNIFLNSIVHDVKTDDGSIIEVVVTESNHRISILPKAVVDCSGEAVIGQNCGHKLIHDKEYQAGAQVFSLAGLNGEDERTISLQILKALRDGITSGALPEACQRVSLVPGSYRDGRANFKLGIPIQITDSPGNTTEINITARDLVKRVVLFLSQTTVAFRNAALTMIAPAAGIRTGLRYHGAGILTDNEVMSCAKDEQGIARGAWPIEIWKVGEQPYLGYFAENDFYDIPATCLESADIYNLWFAGRHISATEGAIGSARVIATSMATGFAAGALASGSVLGIPRKNIIASVQQAMDDQMEFNRAK